MGISVTNVTRKSLQSKDSVKNLAWTIKKKVVTATSGPKLWMVNMSQCILMMVEMKEHISQI